jgi:hypothetical protein
MIADSGRAAPVRLIRPQAVPGLWVDAGSRLGVRASCLRLDCRRVRGTTDVVSADFVDG